MHEERAGEHAHALAVPDVWVVHRVGAQHRAQVALSGARGVCKHVVVRERAVEILLHNIERLVQLVARGQRVRGGNQRRIPARAVRLGFA